MCYYPLIMVINKVLKQLTPERLKREIKAVEKVKLSADLQKWVKEFEKIGNRPNFLWKWLYKINKIWVYSAIQKKYSSSLTRVKTLYNMFIILLDDMAETKERERLLDELLKIPFGSKQIKIARLGKKDRAYLRFSLKVWRRIEKEIKKFPHYKELEELYQYDTAQFLNAVKYAYLVYKNPHYINSHEYWLYIPHSMQILIDADLDLMCSARFDSEDIGRARRTVLCLQEMGRIGNWLVTWEREIKADDFTSVVIAYALERKIITFEDLKNGDKNEIIKKVKNSSVEKSLLKKEWENHYRMLIERGKNSKLINSETISRRARYLIFMHSMSRGLR